ncbi:hypothetical protein CU098_008993, partial [Rhizopus stolonifer]
RKPLGTAVTVSLPHSASLDTDTPHRCIKHWGTGIYMVFLDNRCFHFVGSLRSIMSASMSMDDAVPCITAPKGKEKRDEE